MRIAMLRICLGLAAAIGAAACTQAPPQALGTLEWDRISLPATASEPIVDIAVREGDAVAAGQILLRLDPVRAQAQLDAAEGEVRRLQGQLDALLAGARSETRREALARVREAAAREDYARRQLARIEVLVRRKLLQSAELDQARAEADAAQAALNAARAAQALLANGSRVEDIVQAQAALAAAQAQVRSARVDRDRLNVHAPRPGRIESLPYKLGDQPPLGAPLVLMLVGDAPYARVYVPEPVRASLAIGDSVQVQVDGEQRTFAGRVRMIRSEPSFTPYYALTGKDAARLSYLAEIQLGAEAVDLAVGMPLRARWSQATQR